MGNDWIFLLLFCHIFRTHTEKEEKRKSKGADDHLPWHLTSGSPQKSSLHSRHVLPPNPGLQEHCPVTYNRKITHETQEVKQIFSSMKIHGLQVRMCVGVPQWTLWGRAANEHWEKELLIQAGSCSSSWSPYITEKRAHRLVGAVTQLPSYLWERIFVCLHSFRELILFVFSFFFLGANWDYPQIYIWFIKTQLRQQQETM